MITRREEIDHSHANARIQFNHILDNFRKECLRRVISKQARASGGRRLRREMLRKKCRMEKQETEAAMIVTFMTRRDKKIGELTINFLNAPETQEPTDNINSGQDNE
jgi:hypothetical protein